MTFDEAMKDHSITAIRLPIWAHPDARLELPPVTQHGRGVWCRLIDPSAREEIREQAVCVIAFAGDPCDDFVLYAAGAPSNVGLPK